MAKTYRAECTNVSSLLTCRVQEAKAEGHLGCEVSNMAEKDRSPGNFFQVQDHEVCLPPPPARSPAGGIASFILGPRIEVS